MTLESQYQARLIERLRATYPDCEILKNDSDLHPGFPDLTILWGRHWAVLEVKAAYDSPQQPGQEWFVDKLATHSFAAFIYPENEEEVLYDLQQAFCD